MPDPVLLPTVVLVMPRTALFTAVAPFAFRMIPHALTSTVLLYALMMPWFEAPLTAQFETLSELPRDASIPNVPPLTVMPLATMPSITMPRAPSSSTTGLLGSAALSVASAEPFVLIVTSSRVIVMFSLHVPLTWSTSGDTSGCASIVSMKDWPALPLTLMAGDAGPAYGVSRQTTAITSMRTIASGSTRHMRRFSFRRDSTIRKRSPRERARVDLAPATSGEHLRRQGHRETTTDGRRPRRGGARGFDPKGEVRPRSVSGGAETMPARTKAHRNASGESASRKAAVSRTM